MKFIITTHNPLFYNVLYNEFNNSNNSYRPRVSEKKRLEKLEDGTFYISTQTDDSPFSYHLFLLSELEKATQSGNIQKYHFNFLRNILEKTSTFLGYTKWQDLLPEQSRDEYFRRIINLSSHAKVSSEETTSLNDNEKNVLSFLVREIKKKYNFKIAELENDTI